jgi:hypothetical protein
MKTAKQIALGLTLLCAIQVDAQYYEDALRFSNTNWIHGSSARIQGLAGVQNSLGGDISSMNSNPAGLGFYNRNSMAMTLGLGAQNSDDEFNGLISPNFNNTFNVSNAAIAFNFNKGPYTEEKFKAGTLGISFARINDFNREFQYEGESGTSLLDPILTTLNSGAGGELEDAFIDQFLIDEFYYSASDPAGMDYFPINNGLIIPNQTGESVAWGSPVLGIPYQNESISQRGNQYQMNISWGGNYNDRFYFGAGVGFQSLNFVRERSYNENEYLIGDIVDPVLNGFTLDDKLVARGSGINTSFGAILRPLDFVTLGITYQSPTYLTVNEESEFTLSTDWGNFDYEDLNFSGDIVSLQGVPSYLSNITESTYQIKTPSRLNLGGTIFVEKAGFISADIEFVDYSSAELQSNTFSVLNDNQVIINDFKSVMNYRVGGEYRMDNIRFRGGYSYNPDPTGQNNNRKFITGGIGFFTSDYFIDLAMINTKYNQQYSPYFFNGADLTVDSKIQNTMFTITAGLNF